MLQIQVESASVAGLDWFARSYRYRMRNLCKALGLLLLLLTAQQGAVDHELSHFSRAGNGQLGMHAQIGGHIQLGIDASSLADTTCALCPAFAQAGTAAFSHSLHLPLLARAAAELAPELQILVFDASVPQPRSRGPPALS